MRSLVLLAALAASAPALAQTAAPADLSPRARMTACNADAKTQGLKGADRKTFMASCLKGEPPVASAPAAVPAPISTPTAQAAPAKPASTAAGRQPTQPQLAERERIKQCGAEWRSEKAAGKIPAGQTWPKYWSSCNTRLKGG